MGFFEFPLNNSIFSSSFKNPQKNNQKCGSNCFIKTFSPEILNNNRPQILKRNNHNNNNRKHSLRVLSNASFIRFNLLIHNSIETIKSYKPKFVYILNNISL